MKQNSQPRRAAFDWASITDWQEQCPVCGGDTEFNAAGGIHCTFCGFDSGDSVPADLIASYQRKQARKEDDDAL